MKGQELQKYRKAVLAVSGFLILISLLGAIDVRNLNYSGYTLGPDNVFTAVTEGSPGIKRVVGCFDQSSKRPFVKTSYHSFNSRNPRLFTPRKPKLYPTHRASALCFYHQTYGGSL